MIRPNGMRRLEARKARLESHAAETNPDTVLNAAARFLELRSRSVHEVRRHLADAAFPAELADGAIARLLELRMLDDRAFATAWVESRDRARPRGRSALRGELAQKGIDRETIAAVLSDRDRAAVEAEEEAGSDGDATFADRPIRSADEVSARRLLEKSRTALQRVEDPRVRRQRAYALLARKGFDPEVCREVSGRFAAPGAGLDD
jgi:SOS response regulatory protein OraA/RecX